MNQLLKKLYEELARARALFFNNSFVGRIILKQEIFYKRPRIIHIEPTNDCNIACRSCRRRFMNRKVGYMSFDLFTKIVDEAARIGDVHLELFGGGEPLMHPQFSEMLKYSTTKRDRLKDISFFTNGMLLNKTIVNSIVKLEVDAITISLDGIGYVNERLRRGSVYRVIEENLNYLLDARGSKIKPHVIINATISDQTDKELMVLRQEWQNRLDRLQFSGMIDEPFRVLDIERARKWNPGYMQHKICPYPFSILTVQWNGDVSFCCEDVCGKGVIGNALESDLMGIWHGEKLKRIRKAILAGNVDGIVLCNHCKIFNFREFRLNS